MELRPLLWLHLVGRPDQVLADKPSLLALALSNNVVSNFWIAITVHLLDRRMPSACFTLNWKAMEVVAGEQLTPRR